jgi:transcriptional regulator with XRE-family HTH domain
VSASVNRQAVLARLRKDVDRAGSQKALAAEIGISPAYLSDVLKENRVPGPSILRFYGLRHESTYVEEEQTA